MNIFTYLRKFFIILNLVTVKPLLKNLSICNQKNNNYYLNFSYSVTTSAFSP